MACFKLLRGIQTTSVLLALIPVALHANEGALDTLVVTATRTSRTLADTPIRTQVISRAEIKRKQATNLADALRDVSGLQLVPIHGKPGKSVRLQGMDSDHVLIMVDGRPVSASTGSTIDAQQVTTFGVERIEIIKGPASALYGSSAMGGVINVITSKESGENALGISAQLGSWGDKNLDEEPGNSALSINGSTGSENWIAQFLLSRDHSNGFDLTPDTYANNGAEGNRDNFAARASVFAGENWELYSDIRLYREDLRYRISTLSPGAVDGITKKHKNGYVDRNSLTIGADGQLGSGEFSGFIHAEAYDETTEQDAIASAWTDQSRTGLQENLKLDLQWDHTLSPQQLLTVGFQSGQSSLQQYQRLNDGTDSARIDDIEGKVEQSNSDVYAQHDWLLANEQLELVSGIRYQEDSDFGSHLAPKISFRRTIKKGLVLRGSLGEGYRVPNLKERHYLFDHSANGYRVLGNPDLEPETNSNAQLNLHWSTRSYSITFGVFQNDLKNLIDTGLDSRDDNGIAIYRYLNVNAARIQGADIEVQQNLASGDSISFDITRVSTRNKETNQQLGDRPELQAGALWKKKVSSVIGTSLSWRYQYGGVSNNGDQRKLRHASIVDASAHWKYNANTRLSFNIDNLGNSFFQRQDNSDLRPREGRELRLSVDYQF